MKEKSTFVEVFGDSPQTKVLDFLLRGMGDAFTLYEIRDETSTSYATLKKLMPSLLAKKIVIIKKRVGKSNLYSVNLKNKYVREIIG